MKLLDYIRGLRKGKEAHRLEKESMQDPFLADAMDGYRQVEGDHEQQIKQLRMRVTAHSKKKRNTYAATWSIAACLVIGIGISSYFLLLKKDMGEHSFIAKEGVPQTVADPELTFEQEIVPSSTEKRVPDSGKVRDEKEIAEETTNVAEKRTAKETEKIAKAEIRPVPPAAPTMEPQEEALAIVEDSDSDIAAVDIAAYPNSDAAAAVDVAASAKTMQETQSKEIAGIRSEEQAKVQREAEKGMFQEVIVVGHGAQKKMFATKALQDTVMRPIIPEPVIGMRQYRTYLKKNLVRPADEACANVKGLVVLTFLVDKEGRPFDIKVKKSLCESSDQEAIRLIREGSDWTYGSRPVEIMVEFR